MQITNDAWKLQTGRTKGKSFNCMIKYDEPKIMQGNVNTGGTVPEEEINPFK
jgi:hypothetical protein